MKISVLISPLNADELFFTGKTTVVIDVLRATTTISTALQNGAKEVIPVNTVEFAMKVSGNAFGGQTILGGERNTKKVEGFTLGNSPLEYTQENVFGKSIILFTTNGSKAIVRAKFSENLITCSFNNLGSVANHLLDLNKDFIILCAGANGMFSLEDTICAGKLITELTKLKEEIILTDSARASVSLSKSFGKNISKMIAETEHGRTLIENGYSDDINYCAKLNSIDNVPVFSSGVIKNYEPKVEQSAN
ncbi:MAG: 2-phosphosulfolactate phosphatase [Melioribacteraceae bacterium]|nr:2-phosphosulfolactate phosphatase [Melioribacteraceae bacterium]MCF8355840.1 2-phosphosulfolactate phosphatase [Melioribacteraceae bacterium]MCF8392585.1 2-phosphosulfolactate phosphatase [Melioribacteraceae bacterium]MCF8418543.1 2-phosphosulfolactate phosphatase [Melioribacteraceae bacterium]